MISKIAEAVFDDCCPGIRYTEEDKVFYEQMIKVVLKTMREPSDKMLVEMESKAPQLSCFNTKETSPSYLAWKAAIDAALNE